VIRLFIMKLIQPPIMKHLAILLTLLLFTSCGSSGDDTGGTTGPPAVTNDPPVASDDTISTPSNTSVLIDVLANDTDPDGDVLTITSVSGGIGVATISGDEVDYSPAENWHGIDSFTYTIEDTAGNQASAAVTVTVENQAPVAVDDSVSIPSNSAIFIPVLSNDTDPEGGALTLLAAGTPDNGGTAQAFNNEVHYTPAEDWSGVESFSYVIEDTEGNNATAVVAVTVENQAPVAVDDTASTFSNIDIVIDVLANDTDPEDEVLTIVSVDVSGAEGGVSISDNKVSYSPLENWHGIDSFTYTIEDTAGNQASAVVAVNVTAAGYLVSWGLDTSGQVSNTPTTNDFTKAVGGYGHSVALKSDGSLVSWGDDFSGQVSNTPTTNDFTQIAGGDTHSIALRSDGSLVSWGLDTSGQVSNTPTTNDFVQVAGGGNHSVAVKSDGSLVSWGQDTHGVVSNTPTTNDFTQVATGRQHAVALKSDGSLVSWGNDSMSQVSNTPSTSGFTQVSAGSEHSVALKADGSLVSWGNNATGLVSNTPTTSGFTQVSAGSEHSVALKADGSLVSWGNDTAPGNGVVSNTPTINGFIQVSAGEYHSIAIKSPQTIVVDGAGNGDFTTIQDAIDSAFSGDTIIVRDGTYVENINFGGKAITLQSENGPATTIIDGNFSGTVVTFNSGEGSDSVLDGFTITNGDADGAGVHCGTSCSPTLNNCVFLNNIGYTYGGGMYCLPYSSPTLNGCDFTGNKAKFGGGMYCDTYSSPTLNDCDFTENEATQDGGGLRGSRSSLELQNCTFTNNTATYGGGFYCTDEVEELSSPPTLIDCEFTDNDASSYGGGIYCASSELRLIGCSFASNSSTNDGGGLYMYQTSSALIANCTFNGNSTSGESVGGGVHSENSSGDIYENCEFFNNTAWSGAGLSIYGAGLPEISLESCTFTENISLNDGSGTHGYGGALYSWSASLIIENCLFADNHSLVWAGGIHGRLSNLVLTNCTIANNSAVLGGSGGMRLDNSTAVMRSCIVWGNALYSAGPASQYQFAYSIIEGVDTTGGIGNIDADPLFADPVNGDFHLQHVDTGHAADSPCIDTGNPLTIPYGSTRIDGLPDLGVIDMGYHNL
jgi:predicted outer membrane repeat protein